MIPLSSFLINLLGRHKCFFNVITLLFVQIQRKTQSSKDKGMGHTYIRDPQWCFPHINITIAWLDLITYNVMAILSLLVENTVTLAPLTVLLNPNNDATLCASLRITDDLLKGLASLV